MGTKQALHIGKRVDLRVMELYSIILISLELELLYQMSLSVISWGWSYPSAEETVSIF